MASLKSIPSALTIAGSDSGGGAGVQTDLKTFAAHHVHGLSAITCLTAQNPREVVSVRAVSPGFLAEQLGAVNAFKPASMKTGMLYSKALIEAVLEFATANPRIKLVVDPVMIATSGASLLRPNAVAAMQKLMALAKLVTPNIPEAEALLGVAIRDIETQRQAARALSESLGCAVLVKGGHLPGAKETADMLHWKGDDFILTSPHVKGVRTHGTGCTLSAAITANLAQGKPLLDAVTEAKHFITGAIMHSHRCGRFHVLNPFWPRNGRKR